MDAGRADDLIKPDRMVSRWFRHHGVVVDPGGARDVIAKLVTAIGPHLGRDVTAWEIDHPLWSAGGGLPATMSAYPRVVHRIVCRRAS